MTIHEVITHSLKGNEYVAASCSRCFKNGRMVFRVRKEGHEINQNDIDDVCIRAVRHDGRKMDHPITLLINYKLRHLKGVG